MVERYLSVHGLWPHPIVGTLESWKVRNSGETTDVTTKQNNPEQNRRNSEITCMVNRHFPVYQAE